MADIPGTPHRFIDPSDIDMHADANIIDKSVDEGTAINSAAKFLVRFKGSEAQVRQLRKNFYLHFLAGAITYQEMARFFASPDMTDEELRMIIAAGPSFMQPVSAALLLL